MKNNKSGDPQFFQMVVHEIEILLGGELPKYIMQYLDTAWENKYIIMGAQWLSGRALCS